MKPTQHSATSVSCIQNTLTAVYVLFAILVATSTLYCIVLSYHLGPFRDMWIAMDFIRALFENSPPLSDWWALHGGAHRLLVPRLFFVVEYGVFAGSNLFLIFVSIAVQASVVCVVWRALQQEAHITSAWRYFVTAMTLLMMFNATQLENFIYTFDMQWFVTSAAAVWALYFWNQLFKTQADKNNFSVSMCVAALVLTSVSLLSSFSGLCLLLVLPFLMRVYRLPLWQLCVASLLIVLVFIAYMSGPFGVASVWTVGHDDYSVSAFLDYLRVFALQWIKWVALYFGSPLGREYFWPAALFAYGSLTLVFWNGLTAIRKGPGYFSAFQIWCLALALFAALVGISTGLGRMYFVNTADEDRYQSIVLIYWLVVFAFLLSRALQLQARSQRPYHYVGFAVIIFWTMWVIPVAAIKDARVQVNFFDRVKTANLAIATGQWGYEDIKDSLILGDKWQKLSRPEKHADFLRERRWGVFASPAFARLGSRIERQTVSADSCEGGIHAVVAAAVPYRGYRISGYGQDMVNETLLTNYIAIDDNAEVVGLGRLLRQKNSLLPLTWQAQHSAQWVLYTRNLDEAQTLQILGVRDGDAGYCVMASAKLPGHKG